MEPKYFIENRYSFVVDALKIIDNDDYEVNTPETSFERQVQRQLAIANRLLMTGKYSAALEKYRHVRGLIATLRPHISVVNASLVDYARIDLAQMAGPFVAASANLLRRTPVVDSTVPDKLRLSATAIPGAVVKQFEPFEQAGVRDQEAMIGTLLNQAERLD